MVLRYTTKACLSASVCLLICTAADGQEHKHSGRAALGMWSQAVRSSQVGDHPQAIKLFSTLIKRYPKMENLYSERSFCYMSVGDYNKGIADATTAIKLNPLNLSNYKNRAIAYKKLGKTDLAKKDELKAMAVQKDPKYLQAQAKWQKVNALIGEGKFEESIAVAGTDIDPRFQKRAKQIQKGLTSAIGVMRARQEEDPARAAVAALALTKSNPNITSFMLLGDAYFEQGKFKEAIDAFTKGLEAGKPRSHIVYVLNYRGAAYAEIGQNQKAIEDFTAVIEGRKKNVLKADDAWVIQNGYGRFLAPDLGELYCRRANLFNKQKQYDKAIADCTESMKLGKKNDLALLTRAEAYKRLDQRSKAIDDYSEILRMNPKDEEAYKQRAATYAEAGEYEKAVSDYTKAIELEGDVDWRSFEGRANAYEKLGKRDLARKDRLEVDSLRRQ